MTFRIDKLILGIFVHAVIIWIALVLGYDSYKEIMQEFTPLAKGIKDSIKSAFPVAISIFSLSYLIFYQKRKKENIFLGSRQYGCAIVFYVLLINIFFFSKGKDILVPFNISAVYYVVFLFFFRTLNRFLLVYLPKSKIYSGNLEFIHSLQDYLPPVIYRFLLLYLPKAKIYIRDIYLRRGEMYGRGNSSMPFFIFFMVLLMICASLLMFKVESIAEQLANVAYLSLVIGVGLEVYQSLKYRALDVDNDEH